MWNESGVLSWPLLFRRQYAQPLDIDSVFETLAEMDAYLSNTIRHIGQIATCQETEGVIYIMNNNRDAWVTVKAGNSSLIFSTTSELNTYLTNDDRTAGGVATCLETEGILYIMNNLRTAWISIDFNSKLNSTEFYSHTGDTSIHYTKDTINIADINSAHTHSSDDINGFSDFYYHTGDTTIHYTKDTINISDINSAHTHSISEVNDLQTTLNSKTNITSFNSHITDTSIHFTKNSINIADINSAHTHSINDVNDLQTNLNSKTDLTLFNTHTGETNPHLTEFSDLILTAHTHTISDTLNLQSELNSKLNLTGGTMSGTLKGTTISASTYQGITATMVVNDSTNVEGNTLKDVLDNATLATDGMLLEDNDLFPIAREVVSGGTFVTTNMYHPWDRIKMGLIEASSVKFVATSNELENALASTENFVYIIITKPIVSPISIIYPTNVYITGIGITINDGTFLLNDTNMQIEKNIYFDCPVNINKNTLDNICKIESTDDTIYNIIFRNFKSETPLRIINNSLISNIDITFAHDITIDTINSTGTYNTYINTDLDNNSGDGNGTLVFDTTANLNAYLLNDNRTAGEIATCLENEGVIYILNNSLDAWDDIDIDTKTDLTSFNSHTGDTTIHYTKDSINISDINSAHTHGIDDVLELQTNLNSKVDLTLFNYHSGETNPHLTEFSDLILTAHTHIISDVSNLQNNLDLKTNLSEFYSHTGDTSIHYTKNSINISDINSAHTHGISEVTNLQNVLDSKTDLSLFNSHTGQTNPHLTEFNDLTSTGHTTHIISDIIGLQTSLDLKSTKITFDNTPWVSTATTFTLSPLKRYDFGTTACTTSVVWTLLPMSDITEDCEYWFKIAIDTGGTSHTFTGCTFGINNDPVVAGATYEFHIKKTIVFIRRII